MKNISIMIKPASSMCNMQCRYCFYRDVSNNRDTFSYGLMSNEIASKVLKNIFADISPGASLTIAFQGGEPTMAGLDFYERFVTKAKSMANGISLAWAFQTNGLNIDDRWCQFFVKHKFLVGLSLDVVDHNANRVDINGKGTWNTVLNAQRQFIKHGVKYNILCVLTNQLARYPSRVWKSLNQLNVEYVQFIPCLSDLHKSTPMGLTPERFASFYNNIIPLWHKAFAAGKYISIKLIDDIINLLAKKTVNACGLTGQCSPQFVIESDGGVYPCDFYVMDKYRIGNMCEKSLNHHFESDIMQSFLSKDKEENKLCISCKFRGICNGGCKRMKDAMYISHNDEFCGYGDILSKNWGVFCDVARTI